jgi:hypothetical protein
VSISEDDATTVVLTIDGDLSSTNDDGTGLLRLTYTGDETGLLDADGNFIAAQELTTDVIGNVGAEIDGGPVLVSARTIDSTHVELIYNEPISIASGQSAAAASAFTIRSTSLRAYSATFDLSPVDDGFFGEDGQASPWEVRAIFMADPDDAFVSFYHSYEGNYKGYISLTFSPEGSPITGKTGAGAPSIVADESKIGQVKDTVGSQGGTILQEAPPNP